MEWLFWISLFVMGYAYLGYPVLMGLLSRFKKPLNFEEAGEPEPIAAAVLSVFNEESRIEARLRNLIEVGGPWLREILVVCDGCTDDTEQKIRNFGGGSVAIRVLVNPEKRGKPAGLNRALAETDADFVIFADARQRFETGSVAKLLAPLIADASVGAVSGSLEIEPSVTGAGAGIDVYWRLEKWIRHSESRWFASVGVTGAIYALRRERFRPLPEDTLLDDVVIPMWVAQQGSRVLFEPAALAYDPQRLEPAKENRRKTRTLAGNWQMAFRYPLWALPVAGKLWWQLISHKYLRLLGPFLLLVLFVTNLAIVMNDEGGWLYAGLLAGQGVFYLAASVGLLLGPRSPKLCAIPSAFLFLQIVSLRGLGEYLSARFRKSSAAGW